MQEEQSREDLITDKSLTIYAEPTVKEFIETKYSSAEDSISEEFEATLIENDEI